MEKPAERFLPPAFRTSVIHAGTNRAVGAMRLAGHLFLVLVHEVSHLIDLFLIGHTPGKRP